MQTNDIGFAGIKHRRNPLELQLTAMIDIFSMIVIFLIFGTVFGASEISVPSNIMIPKSHSKEGVESAPRIVIRREAVDISLIDQAIPIDSFRNPDSGEMNSLRGKVKARLDAEKKKTKEGKDVQQQKMLNIIADRTTPYQDIFDVVRVFRDSGFNTLLFVAVGEADMGKK
jgi:biopolymer transport protein ExbD